MNQPLVAFFINNRAEFESIRNGLEILRILGVPYQFEIVNLHGNYDRIVGTCQEVMEKGVEVFIATSSGGGSLASLISGLTNLPVIAVPLSSTPLGGQDALYSATQSETGYPLACVGINNAENAALLAVQILSIKHQKLAEVFRFWRESHQKKSEGGLRELKNAFPNLVTAEITNSIKPDLGSIDTEPGVPQRASKKNSVQPISPGAVLDKSLTERQLESLKVERSSGSKEVQKLGEKNPREFDSEEDTPPLPTD